MKWQSPFAKPLRHRATDAEQRLWYFLRAKRFLGFKFRRQHPIGRFIVDFCCVGRRLIIELDGGQHAEQAVADARRTQNLERYGYRVLRFWDNEVLARTDEVVSAIAAAVAPLPNPPPVDKPDGGRGPERI